MKKILTILLALASLPAFAYSGIGDLWSSFAKGCRMTVTEHMRGEMVVISDCLSDNMSPARNVTSARIENRWNRRTAYAQTTDGSRGLKMIFVHPGENVLHAGDIITLDLIGCTVSIDAEAGDVLVEGILARRNILSCSKGSAVSPKSRKLSELSDDDINTYVELQSVEFAFRDGSYANVHEPFINRMDGWTSLLRDTEGNAIHMHVNMACPWRRTGKMIPQGEVAIRGILVHETNRRIGPEIGRWSIRPIDDKGIAAKSKQSLWKTLVGWEKPEGSPGSLDFELSGTVGNLFNKGVRNDRIYNDVGNTPALFWTDSDSEIKVYSGFNSLCKADGGTVKNGAIMFTAPTASWYEWSPDGKVIDSRAFYIEVSTSKYKSGHFQLAFDWSAGTSDGNKSCFFPIDWRVECSFDGKTWTGVNEDATGLPSIRLHSLPWNDTAIKGSSHNFKIAQGLDAGMGPQQHVFTLPEQAAGRKKLYIRICPSSTWIAKPRVEFETDYRDETVSKTAPYRESWIRFDSIRIDYLK